MGVLLKISTYLIKKLDFTIAFTGVVISVESGINQFRREYGLLNKYDSKVLNLDFELKNENNCWYLIREIFNDFFTESKSNAAHLFLAEMEKK